MKKTQNLFTIPIKYGIIKANLAEVRILKITSINRDEALRYLGYKDNINIDNLTPILDKCENELLKAIEPRFIYKFFPINEVNNTIQVEIQV